MTRNRRSRQGASSPRTAALRAAALTRADAFARWAAHPPGEVVCAAVLVLASAWLAGAAYGIETAGAVVAVATCVAAVLAAFSAVVVWERRRERAMRSGRRGRHARHLARRLT